MTTSTDLECLNAIETTDVTILNEAEILKLRQKIQNYRNFYMQKHRVPPGEVFSSAVISSEKLSELCNGGPKVRIYITKASPDNNIVSGFNFILVSADSEGNSLLEGGKEISNKSVDKNCCKHPPDDSGSGT